MTFRQAFFNLKQGLADTAKETYQQARLDVASRIAESGEGKAAIKDYAVKNYMPYVILGLAVFLIYKLLK